MLVGLHVCTTRNAHGMKCYNIKNTLVYTDNGAAAQFLQHHVHCCQKACQSNNCAAAQLQRNALCCQMHTNGFPDKAPRIVHEVTV